MLNVKQFYTASNRLFRYRQLGEDPGPLYKMTHWSQKMDNGVIICVSFQIEKRLRKIKNKK